jgi:uncharacterized heparinase superfamily protein
MRRSSLVGPTRFRFLHHERDLKTVGWDDPAEAKLWRYNQHYFDDLNAEDAPQRRDWHRWLIEDWLRCNPPAVGTGWEPYPTSLRIVNWVKWVFGGSRLAGEARHSLAIQVRWLTRRIEWHILGNHLFANAKALMFAALYYDGEEADRWRACASSILTRQIEEQILTDGGQFERSPMYHALAVEDVFDLINVMRAYGECLGEGDQMLLERLERIAPVMLVWLAAMSHPDGHIAFFNDAAIGIAPSNDELFAYAERLGFVRPKLLPPVTHLEDSGYVSMRCGAAALILDAAPVGPDYLPGHAHADTLSFELSIGLKRVIVNSGTSVYGTGTERLRQRGTSAHSTLMLDEQNSSEVWSGFRVGRRARILRAAITDQSDCTVVEAAHDGYRHLQGSPVHERNWTLEVGRLFITDTVRGGGQHRATIFFHFPSSIELEVLADSRRVQILSAGQSLAELTVSAEATVNLTASSWHPEFGLAKPSACLRIEVAGSLPLRHETIICWNDLCAY